MKSINIKISQFFAVLMCLFSFQVIAQNETILTKKQTFHIAEYTAFNGKKIKNVNIGWESYGELNADRSNVILITHYFTGTSHAAGKYSKEDKQAGYWDSIIGPGKPIDTNRFYVISSDTLVNANAFDDNVVTTGPATLNPDTGLPYGSSFPVVTIRDFVNVQKLLLESLGISKLYAVVGPSMGSFQAIEWASAYPEWVERMVSVIGIGQADPWTVAALEQWARPITSDPMWKRGSYPLDQQPKLGLANSLALITQNAMHPKIFNQLNKQHDSLQTEPLNSIHQNFAVNEWLWSRAESRSANMDANHIIYLVRACQLFVTGHGSNLKQGLDRINAKTLFLPAQGDLLLMPHMSEQVHNYLVDSGHSSDYEEIRGDWGHLDGIYNIGTQADKLREFLAGNE